MSPDERLRQAATRRPPSEEDVAWLIEQVHMLSSENARLTTKITEVRTEVTNLEDAVQSDGSIPDELHDQPLSRLRHIVGPR